MSTATSRLAGFERRSCVTSPLNGRVSIIPPNAIPVFVLAPRYARDLALAFSESAISCEIVRDATTAAAALIRSDATVAVVDARGAMASALLAAREIGEVVDARPGTMLVLVARGDRGGVAAALAAGATQVLSSPFTAAELGEAIAVLSRIAHRLAAGKELADGNGPLRDPLTGLATAKHAIDWLQGLLEAGHSPDVLLIGIGRFAAINAAHGQPAGDALLQAVAERLTRVVADGDASGGGRLVARMAGAEFAVVLPSSPDDTGAVETARSIVAALETPFASSARIVHLAVRAGIASAQAGDAGETGAAAERLFRQAAAALSVARAGAPGCVELFREDNNGSDPLSHLADLEAELRQALATDSLDIAYQPQVSIQSGEIAGVEALVRWHHPVFGALSAETLLEVAANAEFAPALGAAIRAKALREAMAWPPALAGLRLSVNVTAGDLRAPDFADELLSAISASGFPAERLTLEITESDLIENLDVAASILAGLRSRGIGVALDDFGTGYSSLAYLKSLPLDALKLDKRLTRDLDGAPRDRIVVRVVVALARALGIRVVAEGVETEADLALVSAARCEWYQGFLCSPALPGDRLAAFVADWPSGHEPRLAPPA